jgi:DNA-binding transcriptional LysR family regulator
MEMHQIRYFLALSETLNFTQAAERCNVTQPALTRAIRVLEIELGGELLRRERTLSHLTELGERMLPLMRQCYESALAVRTVAQSIRKGETAPLSLAVSHSVPLTQIATCLRELSRAFPGLQLKLRRCSGNELAEALKSGEVELAVAGPLGDEWSRLDTFLLFEEPFDLFVNRGHKLAGKSRTEIADLSGETLLIDTGCELSESLAGRIRALGAIDLCMHRLANQEDALALLEANLGVAFLPVGAARSHAVKRVPFAGLDLARKVSAYCVSGRRRPPCCATLLNMLRAADWGSEAIEWNRGVINGGART